MRHRVIGVDGNGPAESSLRFGDLLGMQIGISEIVGGISGEIRAIQLQCLLHPGYSPIGVAGARQGMAQLICFKRISRAEIQDFLVLEDSLVKLLATGIIQSQQIMHGNGVFLRIERSSQLFDGGLIPSMLAVFYRIGYQLIHLYAVFWVG